MNPNPRIRAFSHRLYRPGEFYSSRIDAEAKFMKSGVTMDHPTPSDSNSDFFKNSMFYREFLAEREEILTHKWLESEKAGHDIGFEWALLDWIVKHRPSWREQRRQTQHRPPPPSEPS